jgi:hypothetical protein
VKFYTGTKSPHVGEREEYGYSKAWVHHHNRNKHHAEYWWDIGRDGKTHAIEMPPEYFVEMLCDRVAASMIYLGDKYTSSSPLEYYKSHKNENQFSPMVRANLEFCLKEISEYGFDVFAYKNNWIFN